MLGNRIRTRREALQGGMPKLKYLANRGLTIIENLLSGQNLGEWHSGFRAYRREVLATIWDSILTRLTTNPSRCAASRLAANCQKGNARLPHGLLLIF